MPPGQGVSFCCRSRMDRAPRCWHCASSRDRRFRRGYARAPAACAGADWPAMPRPAAVRVLPCCRPPAPRAPLRTSRLVRPAPCGCQGLTSIDANAPLSAARDRLEQPSASRVNRAKEDVTFGRPHHKLAGNQTIPSRLEHKVSRSGACVNTPASAAGALWEEVQCFPISCCTVS